MASEDTIDELLRSQNVIPSPDLLPKLARVKSSRPQNNFSQKFGIGSDLGDLLGDLDGSISYRLNNEIIQRLLRFY